MAKVQGRSTCKVPDLCELYWETLWKMGFRERESAAEPKGWDRGHYEESGKKVCVWEGGVQQTRTTESAMVNSLGVFLKSGKSP